MEAHGIAVVRSAVTSDTVLHYAEGQTGNKLLLVVHCDETKTDFHCQ